MRRLCTLPLLFTAAALAGDVEIIEATAHTTGNSNYRIDVTLHHADTGWDHYADGWRVLSDSGNQLGERILHHPHVNEQPFTRSLSGLKIPNTVQYIEIQAHDNVHGNSKASYRINLR
ncbi:MAG: hypothetical protein GY934_20745 [Gammaproteobacteria bacterium]|nr:hypothetical protein [Gammaproteobacteria bacterium]